MNLESIVKHMAFVVGASLAVGACSAEQGPHAPSFRIEVAPLEIDDVTNACYRVTVTNAENRAGEIVWQQDALCADDFGDGAGALTYVGPCDANVTGQNSITLELIDLYSGSPTPTPIDDDEYVNPCGHIDWDVDRDVIAGEDPEDQNGPCTINRVCQENTDVLVVFDLTIMRDANQGFFDVAVNFADVFCSAKLDCRDHLLHDAGGDRNATAVVAFACSSGENEDTFLRVSDLVLSCTGGTAPVTITIPAETAPGNHGPIDGGVFQSAVYVGDEQLTSNGQPLEKCYWNRAVGLDLAQLEGPCTLSGVATAGSDVDLTQHFDAAGESYPAIVWSVQVLDGANALCSEHSLDALNSDVRTTYVDGDPANTNALNTSVRNALTGAQTFACGAVSCQAGPTDPVSGAPAEVTVSSGDGNTIVVTTGGQPTTITLPAGYSLGSSCARAACCSD